ncbi:MAG: tetratricopeptide repeat protein [Anaerolineaceae bacterium]|nr:tetratricopeptide repeat protein [Anaerolineaceae bacterium]
MKTIRNVFREWDSLNALGKNPLAGMEIVRMRHRAAGYTHTTIGYGLALREVFLAALESMKPNADSPNVKEKRWRPYIILTEQYLNGRNPDWVKDQLHISKGTYYSEQEKALTLLAETFQRWEVERRVPQNPATQEQNGGTPAPFMAPPAPNQALVGREELLGQLKDQLLNHGKHGNAALVGMPGVGKTALAIELAHDPQMRTHFHDGILWAGLGRQPDVLSLLGAWAGALDLSSQAIAARPGIRERAELIHTAIGMRRMLLVIDDAWQIDSALAFKAGGPNCAYLLTSRLADVALDFAPGQTVTVHELSPEDGAHLLQQVAPSAFEAAPQEIRQLVQSAGGLPLALLLLGGYLEKQSYGAQFRRMKDALAHLEAAQARLQVSQPRSPLEAAAGSPGALLSLQNVIGFSDEMLEERAHHALLDLSTFRPKPNTFSEEAALAVIDAPAGLLDSLVDAGLVESAGQGRYTIHHTIYDYASVKGPSPAAQLRLVEYFTVFVETNAMAYARLDQEFANLLQVIELAGTPPYYDHYIRLVTCIYHYLEVRGLYTLCEKYQQQAIQIEAALGDRVGQANFLYQIGSLAIKRGSFRAAQAALLECIRLVQDTPARRLEACTYCDLGLAYYYAGDILAGREAVQQAIRLDRELGLPEEESYTLVVMGYSEESQCNYRQAEIYLRQALEKCQGHPNARCEGWAHYNLSMIYLSMGYLPRAVDEAEQCYRFYQAIGDQRGIGWLHYHYGRVYRQLGEYVNAQSVITQAQHVLGDLGDVMGLAFTINNLGLVAGELGDFDSAWRQTEQALELFEEVECVGVAAANYNLGVLCRKLGDYHRAIPYLESALQYQTHTHYDRAVAKCLAELGWIDYLLGQGDRALERCQQALQAIHGLGARPNEALVANLTGQVQAGLGCLDQAARSFRHALALRKAMGQTHLTLEPLAGLAQVAQRKGDARQAHLYVAKILAYLDARSASASPDVALAGVDTPLQVYLTCYQVLCQEGDPRATEVLDSAARLLHTRAGRISNPVQRRSFLENVPAHRELAQLIEIR